MEEKINSDQKIDSIKYLLDFYFKSKIKIDPYILLLKINDLCYCETKEELDSITNTRS